ncbi:MAG: hypothetical protein PWP23_2287 [Candidatus Sumerlaeota bacterium]|nr:hypothetical protein [Candidatus Sumerlaeota bacterium]
MDVNRLHPVQVEFSYPIGSRVDMIDRLPADLDDEDPDELLEQFSSPREYEERLAPLSIQFNQEVMSGKNPTELQVKFIRTLAKRLDTVSGILERANADNFRERGPVAFFGLGLDPDTIIRIIELDYETADNVYSRIAQLWDDGHTTPVVTTPFHTLLSQYQHEFELRLLSRIALEFYWPMLMKYNRRVKRALGEDVFTCVLWLPEGAFNKKVLEVFHAEFLKRCEEEKVANPHLILLLDTEQSKERETDSLMKRWNTLRPAPTTRDIVSVVYKERLFSDWVVQGHPSTKKQLDRTIAKVDAVLRDRQVDHLWSHFEPLMTLVSTFKTCVNFEQKLIKLTELGYQPCGPDVFVRRKLLKKYGMEDEEPRRTTLEDDTCWSAYEDTPGSLVRFTGVETSAQGKVLGRERPYSRRMTDGVTRRSRGNPCWKPALWAALSNVHRAVVGEPKTFMGGMLGLMREILPIRRVPVARRNIEDFLVRHARIHWKEHFIHHLYSEADIRLDDFARECLLANLPEDSEATDLTDDEIVVCGLAADAVYHAHHGLSSSTFAWEHIDHRAAYHNVAMMCLAAIFAIHALKWTGRNEEADAIFAIYKTELMDFRSAYRRHGIDKLGVDEKMWRATIKSQVADSDLNLVERVARRLGATHLRTMGYRGEFDRKDTGISTACGHIWSHEIEHLNFKWENELFCGLAEE